MQEDFTLEEAIEALDEGIPTVVIPCFLTTNRKQYVREVIRYCKQELNTSKLTRIYLFFQEGISQKNARRTWDEICKRGEALPDHNTDRLHVHSFGNVPTDILLAFIEETPHIEIVEERETHDPIR